jgi:SHAQKYF class myb-like DNA-binding protein
MIEQKGASSSEEHEKIGRWTLEEHQSFLQGYQEHGKCWKKVAAHVKTRSVVQVRTHAQKYLLKIQKSDYHQFKLESPRGPKSILKKILSAPPPGAPPPLLQSFHLLRYSNPEDLPTSYEMLSSFVHARADAGTGVSPSTPFKQSQDDDWFFSSGSEAVTDTSDSGSDRKSSFDSTEAEDDLHLEYTAPPVRVLPMMMATNLPFSPPQVDLQDFFNEIMNFDLSTDYSNLHW